MGNDEIASLAGSVFREVQHCDGTTLTNVLKRILTELQLPVEFGYLAEFWHDNKQFCLAGYWGAEEKRHRPAFDKYYRFNEQTGIYGTRDLHTDSTLFHFLLKSRNHPLEPYPVPDFLSGTAAEHIAVELKHFLRQAGLTTFGPAFFLPFVGKEGRFFIAMAKLPDGAEDVEERYKPRFDLASSLVGLPVLSKGLEPLVKADDNVWNIFRYLSDKLYNMINGMHDTVAHTCRVMRITDHLIRQLTSDGFSWPYGAPVLQLRAASLAHDIGKTYSIRGRNGLPAINQEILEKAKEFTKKQPDQGRKTIKAIRQLSRRRIRIQRDYDMHPVKAVCDIYRDIAYSVDLPNWPMWLLPVMCHHFLDKPKGKLCEARDYLERIDYGECSTVQQVLGKVGKADKLMIQALVVADKIEDELGFKWQKQTETLPKEGINSFLTEYRNSLDPKIVTAVERCTDAIISVYLKDLEL